MARNIHDEREGDDLRCVHCNMRATLAFDETDRLIIVCRNKRCQYVETV